jgi:hypothetical protein
MHMHTYTCMHMHMHMHMPVVTEMWPATMPPHLDTRRPSSRGLATTRTKPIPRRSATPCCAATSRPGAGHEHAMQQPCACHAHTCMLHMHMHNMT